jgi:hypothetical protein
MICWHRSRRNERGHEPVHQRNHPYTQAGGMGVRFTGQEAATNARRKTFLRGQFSFSYQQEGLRNEKSYGTRR